MQNNQQHRYVPVVRQIPYGAPRVPVVQQVRQVRQVQPVKSR